MPSSVLDLVAYQHSRSHSMSEEIESENLNIFTEFLLTAIVQRLVPTSGSSKKKRVKGRKNEIKPVQQKQETSEDTVAELSDFVEFIAQELFETLPVDLRTLSYAAIQNNGSLSDRYALPLTSDQLETILDHCPAEVIDSVRSYGILGEDEELGHFLEPTLTSFITTTTSVPPEHAPSDASARPDGCEICDRTQLPLTYHHLIPRSMHEKAVKRNWHADWELDKVAWLCRACHSFVHRIASNEELARFFYSMDLLLEREDVQKWATWASRIRWKAK